MLTIAIDTETTLITDENPVPDLVCVSMAMGSQSVLHHRTKSGLVKTLSRIIGKEDNRIIFHNAEFDLRVLIKFGVSRHTIHNALKQGRVVCTKTYARLHDITKRGVSPVKGRYSLAGCAQRYLGIEVEKEDTWRLRYGELWDTPIEAWPKAAKDYAINDAVVTLRLYNVLPPLPDVERQTLYDFWLGEVSSHGIKVDAQAAFDIVWKAQNKTQDISKYLIKKKYIEAGKKGKHTLKRKPQQDRVVFAYNRITQPIPRTPKGGIKTDADTLENSGDPDLETIADYKRWADVLSKDVKYLSKRIVRPYFGLANSGRTTCSNPNLQNVKKDMPIRQCFVPREGYAFVICDYSGLELHTLAQVCFTMFGQSALRDVLNSGKDPHAIVASQILGLDYETTKTRCNDEHDSEAYRARQTGKVANFGFPGGSGIDAFRQYARASYKIEISKAEATKLKAAWFTAYPEMRLYFRYLSNPIEPLPHLFSGRLRGNTTFPSAANSLFQGLGSDVAKLGGWYVHEACFDEQSLLFGSHIVNFEHDCLIVEVPIEGMSDSAKETGRLMVKSGETFTPDVPLKAEPCLAWRWDKKASPVYDENGNLIPWEG